MLPQEALDVFAGAARNAVTALYPDASPATIAFEAPRNAAFGDAATNLAFSLAKVARAKPQDIAAAIIERAQHHESRLGSLFSAIEPVAGFINLRFAPHVWQTAVAKILGEAERFGVFPKNSKRISLEFGSANPTGPLVVVQGRTLTIGDTLAKALRFSGYDVHVEWIINDAGAQLEMLGRSLYARYRQIFNPAFPFPEDGYPGDYLPPIAQRIADTDGTKWIESDESAWLAFFSQYGRNVLVEQQQNTVERFGVHYDLWQSEKALHESGRVRAGLQRLIDLGFTYEQDGALFFKATQFGDDKDRVIVRKDGRPTYLGGDIAYHYEKFQRAERVVDILGPDHHGYIGRLKGIAASLGYPDQLDVIIAQQITLMRGTETVSMSKRAGHIVTLDDIIDEVGVDAARFFFVMLATESPLTFDLALAKEKTLENPVYYVQYGYARICSVLRNANSDDVIAASTGAHLEKLDNAAEFTLARRIYDLPSVVKGAAEQEAPHRLARYARDIAADFHSFYTECRILEDDIALRQSRLALCLATKTVLAQAFDLLGVSAPESM